MFLLNSDCVIFLSEIYNISVDYSDAKVIEEKYAESDWAHFLKMVNVDMVCTVWDMDRTESLSSNIQPN